MLSPEVVLSQPALDRPALADRTTRILLSLHGRAAGRLVGVAAVLALHVAGAAMSIPSSAPVVAVTQGVLVAILGGGVVRQGTRFGRFWVRRARALLSGSAWRAERAVVVRPGTWGRATVLGIAGRQVAVARMPVAVEMAVAAAGRVWVAGPDADGWALVRVDGSSVWYAARPRRSEVTPSARVPEGDVVAATATAAVRTARRTIALGALVGAWVVAAATAIADRTPDAAIGVWVVAAGLLAFVVIGAHRQMAAALQLRRLAAARPWIEVPAVVLPWRARPDGTVRAMVTVWIGGTERMLEMPSASVDLLGTIWANGTVWLAGPLGPGQRCAAGFPGAPVLGAGRLS